MIFNWKLLWYNEGTIYKGVVLFTSLVIDI